MSEAGGAAQAAQGKVAPEPVEGRPPPLLEDRMCTAAMVPGILGVAVPFAELALSAPAIPCGVAGLRRVAGSAGRLGGRERARAGIVLGVIGLLLRVPSVFILVRVF